MNKLYPFLLFAFIIACQGPNLDDAKYSLNKTLVDYQWIKVYDSLEAKTFNDYKKNSDHWQKAGFIHFGWKDSTWHFIYGLVVSLDYHIEQHYKLSHHEMVRDSTNPLNEDFTTSAMFSLLSSKDYIQKHTTDSINTYKFYLRDKGNENLVWAVRILPDKYNDQEFAKFKIYRFHIDPTGHDINEIEVSKLDEFTLDNNNHLKLTDTSENVILSGIICAYKYKNQFNKITIEEKTTNISLANKKGVETFTVEAK